MNFLKIAKCVENCIKVVLGAQGCKPHCSTTFFIGILGYFHGNAKIHQFYDILAGWDVFNVESPAGGWKGFQNIPSAISFVRICLKLFLLYFYINGHFC